jgi:hypothetical protein
MEPQLWLHLRFLESEKTSSLAAIEQSNFLFKNKMVLFYGCIGEDAMKMKRWLNVLLILSFAILFGCESKTQETKPEADSKTPASVVPESAPVITASDHSSTITGEGGWKSATGLHPKAQLQASNSYGDMYLVVFSEKKDRYSGVTLEDYSEVTRGHILKTLTSPSMSSDRQVTIDGNPGLQNEIHGYAKSAKIAYIHTVVETPLYFHEIIVWTPENRFQRNRFALENAINSFKEPKQAAATANAK